MRNVKDYAFGDVFARIMTGCGCTTQQQLARRLGITQPTVYDAMTKQRIPKVWLYRLWEEVGLNPMWVLYGEGHKKYLVPSDTPHMLKEGVVNA